MSPLDTARRRSTRLTPYPLVVFGAATFFLVLSPVRIDDHLWLPQQHDLAPVS